MSRPRARAVLRLGAAALAVAALASATYRSLRTRTVQLDRVYRIGFNHNPPFQILRPDGGATGFAVETVDSAARRTGIRLQWVHSPRSVESLKDGSVDLWPVLADLPE